jgi:hypothetical protein
MRFLVLAIALCACNDGVAPPVLEQDLAVRVPDAAVDGGEDLQQAVDLLPMACNTACDCTPGDRCVAHVCTASNPQVFCCGTAACTGSNACETARGQVSQCSAPADAGLFPDAGAASCGDIPCIKGVGGGAFCTVACGRTATCQTVAGKDRCVP